MRPTGNVSQAHIVDQALPPNKRVIPALSRIESAASDTLAKTDNATGVFKKVYIGWSRASVYLVRRRAE
jgi:hypothetical protein